MNKPLTMTIKETQKNIVDICNKSGLPPIILDLIMQNIYSEIRSIAENQAIEEEKAYAESIKEEENKVTENKKVTKKE